MTKFTKLTEFFMGKAAMEVSVELPPIAILTGAADIVREEGKVLRLRLGKILGLIDIDRLAFAQDDRILTLVIP